MHSLPLTFNVGVDSKRTEVAGLNGPDSLSGSLSEILEIRILNLSRRSTQWLIASHGSKGSIVIWWQSTWIWCWIKKEAMLAEILQIGFTIRFAPWLFVVWFIKCFWFFVCQYRTWIQNLFRLTLVTKCRHLKFRADLVGSNFIKILVYTYLKTPKLNLNETKPKQSQILYKFWLPAINRLISFFITL